MDVGFNKTGREQALNLVSIFKQKDQMKSVGLAACDLGIDGAKAVADYVSVSSSLTKIEYVCPKSELARLGNTCPTHLSHTYCLAQSEIQ